MEFVKIAEGIWKASAGNTVNTGIFRFVDLKPKLETINSMGECSFPFMDEIKYEKVINKNVVLVPLDETEKLYGLGLNFKSISRRGSVMHLHCDHYAGNDNGRTHVPAPFYVSDKGYGILIDTSEYISFYMGGSVRRDAKRFPPEQDRGGDEWSADTPAEYVEASFEGDGADVYVFSGKNAGEVVAKYNLFCGGGAMVPKWGLGFWHRTHIQFGENEVYGEIKQFEERNFEVDVIGLEPGWHSNSYPCTYEWSRERFPNPKRFVKTLGDKNIRVNLWENMYVSKKARIYDDMLPLSGSHKVWNGIVPDYTLGKACDIISAQHEADHVSIGVSGYKIDECDGFDGWLWPDHASFPSGNSAATLRSVFGLLVQQLQYKLYKKYNRRTYGLVRASNIGESNLPFCLYNDCYSFSEFLTGLANSSFCGCLWVPEVRDAQTAEEWVRRFQLCVFSPMLMLNAWANGVKPWLFEEVTDIIRDTVKMRKQLLPYNYTAFYRYYSKGIPPFRALCLDFSGMKESVSGGELDHTSNPYQLQKINDITDQYMAGDCIMAAPMFPGQKSRIVILPPVKWYDYYSGEYVGCGEEIKTECPLEKIPLYVREGGMIPMLTENGTITVHCYGDMGESEIYDDDGETFDYENGICALIKISFKRENGTVVGKYETASNGFETKYKRIIFE